MSPGHAAQAPHRMRTQWHIPHCRLSCMTVADGLAPRTWRSLRRGRRAASAAASPATVALIPAPSAAAPSAAAGPGLDGPALVALASAGHRVTNNSDPCTCFQHLRKASVLVCWVSRNH